MGFGGPETAVDNGVPMNALPGPHHLLDHLAVTERGQGVNTGDLASFAESFAAYSTSRITGTGADQYGDTGRVQRWETLTPVEQIAELLDELADVQNYAAFTAASLLRMAADISNMPASGGVPQ